MCVWVLMRTYFRVAGLTCVCVCVGMYMCVCLCVRVCVCACRLSAMCLHAGMGGGGAPWRAAASAIDYEGGLDACLAKALNDGTCVCVCVCVRLWVSVSSCMYLSMRFRMDFLA